MAPRHAGNFESTADGRALGERLLAEGADIILPVAGNVGLGTVRLTVQSVQAGIMAGEIQTLP